MNQGLLTALNQLHFVLDAHLLCIIASGEIVREFQNATIVLGDGLPYPKKIVRSKKGSPEVTNPPQTLLRAFGEIHF